MDQETRLANREAIRRTMQHVAPGSEWRPLTAAAWREARWNHLKKSKHESDKKGARDAWIRNKKKIRKAGNPFVDDEARWSDSLGFLQQMPANHLWSFDLSEDPLALHHPVVAVFPIARLGNRIRKKEPGATPLDLRWVMRTGNLSGRDSKTYKRLQKDSEERYRKLGYDPALVTTPLSEMGWEAFGTGPSENQYDQVAFVSKSLGISPEPSQVPPANWRLPTVLGPEKTSSSGGGIALAVAGVSVVGVGIYAAMKARG